MEPRQWHPFAKLWPMMADDELQALADDIRANGLGQPILLDAEGRIVDGRNRSAACLIAGVEPRYETLPPMDAGDLLRRLVSANSRRRQMTAAQAAAVAAKASELFVSLEAEAEKRRAEGNARGGRARADEDAAGKSRAHAPATSEPGRVRDQVAEAFGVSGRSVATAKRIKAADPEKLEEVARGEKSLRQAEREVFPEKAKPKATAAAKATANGKAETTAVAVPARKLTVEEVVRVVRDLFESARRDLDPPTFEAARKRVRQLCSAAKPSDGATAADLAERLYAEYPRKIGKGQAIRAILGALRKRPFEELLSAVTEFAAAVEGADMQYVPHPSTWFNGERWSDDRSEWSRVGRERANGHGGAANPEHKFRGLASFVARGEDDAA